ILIHTGIRLSVENVSWEVVSDVCVTVDCSVVLSAAKFLISSGTSFILTLSIVKAESDAGYSYSYHL
ncbi:MAG: hypothetical protein IK059_03345, partial [Firmicutes bacterium]|nr:hypothetical protein [Bacillota bacterium]